jgi:hypothetical protein
MSRPLQNLVDGRWRDGRGAATVDLNPAARPAQQVAAGGLA